MAFAGMNYLAVLIAAIAAFVIGAGYYGILGKPWMKAARIDPASAQMSPVLFAISFASELVSGVITHLSDIDERIAEKSKHWSMARMARVDLNILRLAVFELLYRPDIPKNVTMNEAIEVAKKFGAEDSASFVNGILDEIASSVTDKE